MTLQERTNQAGFTTITVLVLAAVLLSLLSVVAELNYAFHAQNKRLARDVQVQAARLEFSAQNRGG